MFLQLIHFSNQNQSKSSRILTIVLKLPRKGWWWQKHLQRIISISLKLIQWEESMLIFLKENQYTFMEVKNWIIMKSKWLNSERRCSQIKYILMIRNVSGSILIQELLMNRKRENYLLVFQKCTQKINLNMWLSSLKMNGWSCQNDPENKIS